MADALYQQAVALYKKKSYREALNTLQQVLELDPNHTHALVKLSNTLLKLEDISNFQLMIDCTEKALQLDPNLKSAHVTKGQILLLSSALVEDENTNYLQLAMDECEKAQAIEPNCIRAMLLKQALFGRMNNYKAAFDCSDKALALKPDSTQALLLRGSMLMILKQHGSELAQNENPMDLFNKILSKNPNNDDALYVKVMLLLSENKKDEAKTTLQHLITCATEKYLEKAQEMMAVFNE